MVVGRGKVETLAARHPGYALAVNASFFDPPTGAICSDVAQGGKVIASSGMPRPYLAVKGREIWFGRGVPVAAKVDFAAGAGPMLLSGGKKAPVLAGETYGPDIVPGGETIRNQRMAVGIAGSRLCFVTLWGTFEDVRRELLAAGCTDAMNLDGGGSAEWAEAGETIIGVDKTGYIRPVVNALVAMKAEIAPLIIRQQLLQLGADHNRPGTALNPQGLIIHETATQNASAADEAAYFAGADRGASAHYFVDDREAVLIIPENEQAQHAGPTANTRYLGIEMCHFDDARFAAAWHNTVLLATDICRRHGWTAGPNVYSHKWASDTFKETTHQDPYDYFKAHGKTFQAFCDDVDTALKAFSAAPAQPTDPEKEQLRAENAELKSQLAADEVIISDLTGRLNAVKNLVAQWK